MNFIGVGAKFDCSNRAFSAVAPIKFDSGPSALNCLGREPDTAASFISCADEFAICIQHYRMGAAKEEVFTIPLLLMREFCDEMAGDPRISPRFHAEQVFFKMDARKSDGLLQRHVEIDQIG